MLTDCLLDRGLDGEQCTIPKLVLRRCWLTHSGGTPLHLSNARIEGPLEVEGCVLVASPDANAAVDIDGGNIGGEVRFSGSQLTHLAGPAFRADGLSAKASVFLDDGFSAQGDTSRGTVRLMASDVAGQFAIDDARIINKSGPALASDGLNVGRGFFFTQVRATGHGYRGTVRLLRASIGGQLNFSGSEVKNDDGTALDADGLHVRGDLYLSDGFFAQGTGMHGAVRLLGAQINGEFSVSSSDLVNSTGPAFLAYDMQVGSDLNFLRSARVHGAGELGAVHLSRCQLKGHLDCRTAQFSNGSGPALDVGGAQIDGEFRIGGGFRAHGASDSGAVRLSRARILGTVSASDCQLSNESGPALVADGVRVDNDLYLDAGFVARGTGAEGTVRLPGAQIKGQFSCQGALLVNDTGPVLVCAGMNVSEDVFFDKEFRVESLEKRALIDLESAVVGQLLLDPKLNPSSGAGPYWQLDGCMHRGLPRPDDLEWWLRLLSLRTSGYAAQPYQQLADAHRAAGHERDLRAVNVAQRRDQIERGRLTSRQRLWGRFTGLALGYGWAPWRALYGLGLTLLISVTVVLALGSNGALVAANTQQSSATAPVQVGAVVSRRCSLVETVGVGIDLGVPFLGQASRTSGRCAITNDPRSSAATALTICKWVLQALSWAWAALFIAGFTSIVRKV